MASATPKRYAVAPLGTSAAVSSSPISRCEGRTARGAPGRRRAHQGRAHRIRLQVPRLRLVNAQTPMQSITEGRRDGREHANKPINAQVGIAGSTLSMGWECGQALRNAAALHLVPRVSSLGVVPNSIVRQLCRGRKCCAAKGEREVAYGTRKARRAPSANIFSLKT